MELEATGFQVVKERVVVLLGVSMRPRIISRMDFAL